MTAFVLVPGAWLGGWCWRRLVPPLEEAGHAVYRPSLTGLGERAHLGTPAVDLDTHIADVVNLLVWEELREVVLVGHSYAGFVITGVADRVPERLVRLVYLDAMVPDDGQAFFDFTPPAQRAHIEASARAEGGGWRWPIPADLGSAASDLTPSDNRRLRDKAVGHPIGTLAQPLRLTKPAGAGLPRTYLCCRPGREEYPEFLAPMRADPAWRFRDLATGHYPMFSAPQELADLLLDEASALGGA